jgi:hypothetical protein
MTWTTTEVIDAPFVNGQCVTRSGYTYLEITLTPNAAQHRSLFRARSSTFMRSSLRALTRVSQAPGVAPGRPCTIRRAS